MLAIRPLDAKVPINDQLGDNLSPVILINVFTVDPADVDALLKAWEHDANWMKRWGIPLAPRVEFQRTA